MRCFKCGGEYREKLGNLRIKNDNIGTYIVYGVAWKECPKCKKKRYPIATVEKMEAIEQETRDSLLQNEYHLSDFVSSTIAASILGITRQAIHKHRRIRRGFIYATVFDGKKVFLKQSVEAYKNTGDGRIQLYRGVERNLVDLRWTPEAVIPAKALEAMTASVVGARGNYLDIHRGITSSLHYKKEEQSNEQAIRH